jgi:hypothetical protein
MFFYLYAIIELLAVLLDSNLIPTASPTYQVSLGIGAFSVPFLINVWGVGFAVVVCGSIHRLGCRSLLLPSHQWFCWLPIRRGRHALIFMGAAVLSCLDDETAY